MLRDGKVTTIAAVELVPGDVVEMAVGAKVPADLRVAKLHSRNFRVDQVWRTFAQNINISRNCAMCVYVFALSNVCAAVSTN